MSDILEDLATQANQRGLAGTVEVRAHEEIRRLREAIEPFAKYADFWSGAKADTVIVNASNTGVDLTMGDCQRARATLNPAQHNAGLFD